MQLAIPLSSVNANYVYFVDRKRNTVIEGEFTKILYSSGDFVMSGLFVHCPVGVLRAVRHPVPPVVSTPPPGFLPLPGVAAGCGGGQGPDAAADPQLPFRECLERLCALERELLANYGILYAPTKQPLYCLQNHLLTAAVSQRSLWGDTVDKRSGCCCVIKVSGVWETREHVGITVKVHVHPCPSSSPLPLQGVQ
jgi:hypothetical protein